ncbi:Carboxymethylenebutenolidase [Halomonadaceae bacterium LMG 33818]|uniref:dienelactone hydrolase family protein n=1 Tax=Cernens ardua TaxID=3402176 RepID=UPI003EDB961D
MTRTVELVSKDATKISAYVAQPATAPKGGVVVLQEIFGVNSHIRSVADRFAEAGYLAIAPALFDRIRTGIELGYDGEDLSSALALMGQLDIDESLEDTQAAVDFLQDQGISNISVVGFCFGGSLAWLAASRLNHLVASVGYYGGKIPDDVNEEPKVPVLLHFGELDDHIPLEGIDKVKAAHPEVDIHVYPGAGHGFNCDLRASYEPDSAAAAWQRTLAFLDKAHS